MFSYIAYVQLDMSEHYNGCQIVAALPVCKITDSSVLRFYVLWFFVVKNGLIGARSGAPGVPAQTTRTTLGARGGAPGVPAQTIRTN